MTREELVSIINCSDPCWEGPLDWHRICADRILAALEKEREGEVVLVEKIYVETDGCIPLNDYEYVPTDMAGKRGALIFRPTKAEKGGGL